jgi:hypothetical protein
LLGGPNNAAYTAAFNRAREIAGDIAEGEVYRRGFLGYDQTTLALCSLRRSNSIESRTPQTCSEQCTSLDTQIACVPWTMCDTIERCCSRSDSVSDCFRGQ